VKRAVRISEPATQELAAAVRWYEIGRPGLGGEFFDVVVDLLATLESRSEIGGVVGSEPQTRRALVRRFPYQVVYRLTTTEIVIIAVAHTKRRPGYWKSRN
jgi:plasmid stabilization system protein ParE